MRNRVRRLLLLVLLIFSVKTAYADSIPLQLRTDGDGYMWGSRYLGDQFFGDLRDLMDQPYAEADGKIAWAYFRNNNWSRNDIRISGHRTNPDRQIQLVPEPPAWPLVALGVGLIFVHLKWRRGNLMRN